LAQENQQKKISIGLTLSLEDPCLFTGFVQDPNNPNSYVFNHPLSLDLYVDNFVYFLEDPMVEDLFCHLLSKHCKEDFMVHMNQSGFASNLVEISFAKPMMQTHWQPHISPEFLSILLLL
jgi:hypothetical protein